MPILIGNLKRKGAEAWINRILDAGKIHSAGEDCMWQRTE